MEKERDKVISFQPTEEEQAFFQVARSLAVEKIRPAARECEKRRTVSADLSDRVDELGLSALELPESWGGLELPLLSQALIWQGLSYGDLGVIQGLPGAGEASSLFRLSSEHRVWHRYREMAKGGWPTVAWIDEAEQKRTAEGSDSRAPARQRIYCGPGCRLQSAWRRKPTGRSSPLGTKKRKRYCSPLMSEYGRSKKET